MDDRVLIGGPDARIAAELTLSSNQRLRIMSLFLLYVAQGLPVGLTNFALPAWLAQNGASAGAIGSVLALANLPWALKLFYGPFMDRFAFLEMGRRRPWVIAAQCGILLGLLAMAITNPAPLDLGVIGALCFVVNFAGSWQDVAVDGLAVDVVPTDEIPRANGFMFAGQAVGIAAGSAVAGACIALYGLEAAMLVLAAIVASILILVLAVRERPGERLLPWTNGVAAQANIDRHVGAFGPILRGLFAVMLHRDTLIFIPALVAGGAVGGLFIGLAPIFAADVLGWEKSTFANWSGQAKLVAGLGGAIIFGLLVERFGARRMMVVGLVAYALAALVMLALQPRWTDPRLLIAAIFCFSALLTFRNITGGSVSMRLCVPAVAASQFSAFMAIMNVGQTGALASLGLLDRLGGIPAMFGAIIVIGLIGAMAAVVAKVGR